VISSLAHINASIIQGSRMGHSKLLSGHLRSKTSPQLQLYLQIC
jgi:hypothetical protein